MMAVSYSKQQTFSAECMLLSPTIVSDSHDESQIQEIKVSN